MKILYHHRVASKDGQYVHVEEIDGALRSLSHKIIMREPASIHNKDFGKISNLVRVIRTLLPGFTCERYNLFYSSGIFAKKRYDLPLLFDLLLDSVNLNEVVASPNRLSNSDSQVKNSA